jgi:hypothetical protein
MNRRGLFAAFALAPIMAVEAFAKPKPEGEPRSSQNSLTLCGTSAPVERMRIDGSGNVGIMTHGWDATDPDKQVMMAVGEDGNLWLRSKGVEWKRVVTE